MKRSLLILLSLLTFLHVSAQDFTITDYDIEVEVETDGSIDIKEVIQVQFSKQKHGIYRAIPYRYQRDGQTVGLSVTDIDVVGHKSKIQRKSGIVNIRIGDPDRKVSGGQTYEIHYTIENGIQSYDSHQELYLDLIGTQWKADIERMQYRVALPKSISLADTDLLATTGAEGTTKAGISIDQATSRTITGALHRTLKAGEGATIAVRLPKTYLSVAEMQANRYHQEQALKKERREQQNAWWLAIPIGLFGLFVDWCRRVRGGRRREGDLKTYPYPPEGLTSAHVGAYIDQTAHTRDVISLIPYWAAEGYLTITPMDDDMLLTKTHAIPDDLPDYEVLVYDKLFERRDEVRLKDVSEKMYTTLAAAKSMLTKEVNAQGYYDERFIYWFRSWRVAIFPLVMVTIGVLCLALFFQFVTGIVCLVLAFVSLFFSLGKKPLSAYGQEMKDRLDGLQAFLRDVPASEVDSLVKHDAKYFEKMLPFAVAFGIEKSFVPKFEAVLDRLPLWYIATNGADRSFAHFSSSFDTQVIDSAFTSMPASAGGGGGGFSSGGGVGGGGGGSW